MKGEFKIAGGGVVRMVLEGLQRDRDRLREAGEGKEAAADLKALAENELVSVQLHSPEGDELTEENDFFLIFRFDCPDEVYAEVTAQDLCKRCGKWSAFVKDPDDDPPGCWCDFCRGCQESWTGECLGTICSSCGFCQTHAYEANRQGEGSCVECTELAP